MVTLADLLGKTSIQPQIQQPIRQSWDKPVSEAATPLISPQKFRRYFDIGETVMGANQTETIFNMQFSLPVIIKEVLLYGGSTNTDHSGNSPTLYVDDEIIYPETTIAELVDYHIATPVDNVAAQSETGTMTEAQYNITDNLAATAVAASHTITGTRTIAAHTITKNAEFGGLISAGYSTVSYKWWCVMFKLDTYAQRSIKATLKNVSGAVADTVDYTIITDRPIESKYSASRTYL